MTWDWDELFEGWCEEFAPETFFEQTSRTFMAALRGRAKFHHREAERDLALAYQTGAFSRASKVRPLSYYMKQLRKGETNKAAEALSFFHSLKARGIPVKITRVPREAQKA